MYSRSEPPPPVMPRPDAYPPDVDDVPHAEHGPEHIPAYNPTTPPTHGSREDWYRHFDALKRAGTGGLSTVQSGLDPDEDT